MRSSRFISHIISTVFLTVVYVFSLSEGLFLSILSIGEVSAVYTESSDDTYGFYKKKLESALQDMERDFKVNGSITDGNISSVRSLINEAYIRLPDTPDDASKNENMKKSVDLYLDLAAKNKSSQTQVSNAIQQAGRFITEASIGQIAGSISANPAEGNAPLTTSFLASAKDPSGVNIIDSNYIWWTRENGGYRKELGRGPTLTYTFAKEGNYQVFLDVVSGSRNKKGKTDVLPLSISQDISVKPRLGNIILLINGINVSSIDTLKIPPSIGKIGIILDATASRAVSNGTITKTKWDFGNGNTSEYDGSPVIERQIFANIGKYPINIEISTNQGQIFKKTIQILVMDAAAVINVDKELAYIGEDVTMTARSYLANSSNMEYAWEIKSADGIDGKIASKGGAIFSYKFLKVGQYIISLQARSPNGSIDQDSRIITIESREPSINLDAPTLQSSEKPNTILFDASRSVDPDTNSIKNLSYTWVIDGEKVTLDAIKKEGAIGTYTFAEKGTHTVSLTVSNTYGKVKTVDKTFEVSSTLRVGMSIAPRAATLGTLINFQARAPEARFFEWNTGDGAPTINGTIDNITHIYKKTGIYSVTLTVKNGDGTEINTIERKVYITDTNTPFALIEVKNSEGSVIENRDTCNGSGAFEVTRAGNTTLEGSNSINIDGSTSGIFYTWKYLDKVKTGPSISEKFSELGCFPIELSVRSERNGATHTSKSFIHIKNIAPKITSVDTSVDANKKDSQKIIVNVTANGARDDDGVITSYVWYYKTESDTEPQNIKITQSPRTSFVLPNISEKYTFGVILEDNDGARINSIDTIKDQTPLLITNDNGNINLPLISLNVSKSQVLAGDAVDFSVSAKNILGTDITTKSEYQWDFDGDGKIDKKTVEPKATFIYPASGKYTMKIKVLYNGVSNTKYQIINVKNELKARVEGYEKGDLVYLLNTSQGLYETSSWKLGERESDSLYSIIVPKLALSNHPSLTVSTASLESSTIDILPEMISVIPGSTGGSISLQSSPRMLDDTITLKSRGEKLIISAFGNEGSQYVIDLDTKIDSDLDGIGDNDLDNKNTPSFRDGSAFLVENISDSRIRSRQIKVTVSRDGIVIGTRLISVVLDYIIDTNTLTPSDLSGTGGAIMGKTDKENLEKLQGKIRNLDSNDRIVLTQQYNTIIEDWGDLHDRTQGLLTLQKEINESQTMNDTLKGEFSDILDIILVGDAQATNDVSVASRVIEGLIEQSNPERSFIIERLEKIKSHPGNLSENKILGQEILEKVKVDSHLSNEDKLLIRSQLLIIINGGQKNISQEETDKLVKEAGNSGGILGFVGGIVKIFLIIFGVIIFLFLIGYIFYRFSRKENDMGFQDFLIDSIAHSKSPKPPTVKTEDRVKKIIIDPMSSIIVPPVSAAISHDPIINISGESMPIIVPRPEITIGTTHAVTTVAPPIIVNDPKSATIPEWLKPIKKGEELNEGIAPPQGELSGSNDTPLTGSDLNIVDEEIKAPIHDTTLIPDWLKAPGQEEIASIEHQESLNILSPKEGEAATINIVPVSTELPDWLKSSVEIPQYQAIEENSPLLVKKKGIAKKKVNEKSKSEQKKEISNENIDNIPDWLK